MQYQPIILETNKRPSILDNRSTTRILDVTLRIPPPAYIFSLTHHQHQASTILSGYKPHGNRSSLGIDHFQPPSKRCLANGIMLSQRFSKISIHIPNHRRGATHLHQSIHFPDHQHQQPVLNYFPRHHRNGGDWSPGVVARDHGLERLIHPPRAVR